MPLGVGFLAYSRVFALLLFESVLALGRPLNVLILQRHRYVFPKPI